MQRNSDRYLELAAKRGVLAGDDCGGAVARGDVDVGGDVLPADPRLTAQGALDGEVLTRQHLVFLKQYPQHNPLMSLSKAHVQHIKGMGFIKLQQAHAQQRTFATLESNEAVKWGNFP